jgi:epoxyqueuosine reductase
LDARRCIAYLTIEHDGGIPLEFRSAVGDRLFGCDECLDVCPWNRWAVVTQEARFAPRDLPLMREMLAWGEVEFMERLRGSPMRRLKLKRFKRNICVVLGNVGGAADAPALDELSQGEDAMLAEHAGWALAEIAKRA